MSQYSDDDIIKYSKEIINEVQTFVNHSYGVYAQRYHNIDEHRWDIKQELIAKRAFWVGNAKANGTVDGVKKRYAQWIVDKEGHSVNELDVKGLDVVRSNFPLKFRKFMSEVLIDILHDNDADTMNAKVRSFKNEIDSIDINDILLPTGVSLDKYENDGGFSYKKGTPVHVKAVFNYNNLLKLHKIFNISEISSGDKVMWGYLKDNPYKLDSVAIKGFEDPPEILEFVNKYIDREKIFDSVLKTKLINFWASLGWGDIILNDAIDNFFDFT